MTLHLVQFHDKADRHVAIVDGNELVVLDGTASVYGLAQAALSEGKTLEEMARERAGASRVDYDRVIDERRLSCPVTHDDPLRCHVSGTGLTHLGSADARDKMHALTAQDAAMTDSMRMFKWGIERGRPAGDAVGVQPEWFYKGNGRFLVAPEQKLRSPGFAEDGGEEPELAGIYLIGPNGVPMRLGFAIANEFSDHVMERRNYLFLAHSKLRQSSFGPELRIGLLPADVRGTSRIRRGESILWERPFLTGESNMSHTLANLEHHHFKYAEHRVPGDLHIHYFGTATLSFADGMKAENGDRFEIEAEGFGRPLRNVVEIDRGPETVTRVAAL